MTRFAKALVLAGGTLAFSAAGVEGAILGVKGNGDVYTINPMNGIAQVFRDYIDINSTASGANSPNALGYDASTGTVLFANSTEAGSNTFYVNGGTINDGSQTSIPISNTPFTGPAIAGAGVGGPEGSSRYYYIDANGYFRSVDLSGGNPVQIGQVDEQFRKNENGVTVAAGLGDIAILGSTAYIAYSAGTPDNRVNYFGTYDFTDAVDPFDIGVLNTNGVRYAGLAFMGSQLYGLIVGGGVGGDAIVALNSNGAEVGDRQTIKVGGVAQLGFTDLAAIPLPAAAWLLLTAMASLFGIRLLRRGTA